MRQMFWKLLFAFWQIFALPKMIDVKAYYRDEKSIIQQSI
jgi:hypothetical protein